MDDELLKEHRELELLRQASSLHGFSKRGKNRKMTKQMREKKEKRMKERTEKMNWVDKHLPKDS